MRPKRLDSRSDCGVETTLSVVGGLWKPLILYHLMGGKKRFMELSRLVPQATQRMLTLQLRELEADGVVTRRVFAEVPPRVEYAVTDFGRTLVPVLAALREWGERYRVERQGLAPREECGTVEGPPPAKVQRRGASAPGLSPDPDSDRAAG
ncbi:winged helix-turn-helix transcriptional regulator [Phenylobacterium sp.]|uniref:winged helix-turn-helix transcriptional regulator n=1 Tax=Phenylobacterium sp. TaxID=1871053 RepID=UPI002FCB4DE4